MLGRLVEKLLAREQSAVMPETDTTPLAVCVLMIEAAGADDDFTDDERTHIVNVLRKRFHLSEEEAHELIEEAARAREGRALLADTSPAPATAAVRFIKSRRFDWVMVLEPPEMVTSVDCRESRAP